MAGQLACALVLLVSAALFLRALVVGQRIDVVFDRDHVALDSVALSVLVATTEKLLAIRTAS